MHLVQIDIDLTQDGRPIAFHSCDIDESSVIDVLTKLASGETDHVKAGWSAETKLPGHPDGTTRWQVLLAQSNKAAHKDKLAPVIAAIKK